MKKLIYISIVFICITFIFNQYGARGSRLSDKEKINDFNYLYNIISENYSFSNKNSNWLNRKDEFINAIKSTDSDESFFEKLCDILKDVNDGHVTMFTLSRDTISELKGRVNSVKNTDFKPNFNETKTIEMLENVNFNKRYCGNSNNKIYNNEDNFKECEPIIIKDVIDGKVGYIKINTFDANLIEEDRLVIRDYLNKISNYRTLIVDVRGNCGGQTDYWKEMFLPMILDKSTSYKYYLFYKGGNLSKEYLDSTYGVNSKSVKPVNTSIKQVLKDIPENVVEEYSYYLEQTITVEPDYNSKKFNGNIYLLINEDVYSATDEFVNFCKKTGIATIVGTKTNGGGFGPAPTGMVLPNSGFGFGITLGLITDATGNTESMNSTKADVYVEDVIRNYNLNNDTCIKKVLEIEEIKCFHYKLTL